MTTFLSNDHKAREQRSAARVIATLREEAQEQTGTRVARIWRELAYELERRWPQGPRRET